MFAAFAAFAVTVVAGAAAFFGTNAAADAAAADAQGDA
jgi:hypothetical protein